MKPFGKIAAGALAIAAAGGAVVAAATPAEARVVIGVGFGVPVYPAYYPPPCYGYYCGYPAYYGPYVGGYWGGYWVGGRYVRHWYPRRWRAGYRWHRWH